MPVENPTVALEQEKSAPRQGPLKVGFVSLGCPKNLVDSEVMMGMLQTGGAQITARAEDADVIVVNTCSFIDSAKQESVNTILEMAQHKVSGKAQKLIVAGCLVERYRTEIQKNIPEVDAVVGTGELEEILAAAGISAGGSPADESPFVILNHSSNSQALKSGLPARAEGLAREQSGRFSRAEWDGAIADLPNYLYDETTPRVLATPKASAYIKIAEGCDHPCGFCIIPQLRGKFRSRQFESVVAEAERLVASGVREITLIGQDTTCYGEDLGLKDGLACCSNGWRRLKICAGCAFSMPIPTRSPASCWRPLRAMKKFAPTWMFRCSMLPPRAQTHEARRRRGHISEVGGEDAAHDSWDRRCALRLSLVFRARRKQILRTLPALSARRSLIGWVSSATPTKTARRPTPWTTKCRRGRLKRRRKKLMQIQRQISKKSKKQAGGPGM